MMRAGAIALGAVALVVIDGPVRLTEFVDDAPDGGDPIPTDQTCGV
jgi:hypothetical protein